MNARKYFVWVFAAVSIATISLACNFLTQIINPAEQKTSVEEVPQPGVFATLTAQVLSEGETVPPSGQMKETTAPALGEGSMSLIRQWASEAVASSEFGSESWSAFQATGKPNTTECGDYETAWASADANTRDWIILYYPKPVYAVEVNLYQTYNPDQIVAVELIDLQGNFVNVYTAEPRKVETCPFVLSIPTAFSGVLAQGVRITIDQSVLNQGWNEIDAVEIVGVPGEGTPTRPPLP